MPSDGINGFAHLTQLALAADGTFAAIALACAAIKCWCNCDSNSKALERIRSAPTVRIADLRSLLSSSSNEEDDQSEPSSQKLIIVRGLVEAKSAVDRNWLGLKPGVLTCPESGDVGVALESSQTCIYHEWTGIFQWASPLRSLLWKVSEKKSKSLRTVPFVLIESGRWPHSDYVIVDMDGSTHHLPLTMAHSHLVPVPASPYTLFQTIFGHKYPVAVLNEQKILPLGKEISAVGNCSLKDGNPQIKSCKDLPFFLSTMTKDQMVIDLISRIDLLFWGGIVLGLLSLGLLGYAMPRNWRRWKEWREQRRLHLSRDTDVAAALEVPEEDETEEIQDGQLCVICLMRRRRSAFVPCGHLACCHTCALVVERESTPKCPICRQTVRGSVRIYDS